MAEAITQWDFAILDAIQAGMKCDFLDAVMPWITVLCKGGILWILLGLLLLFFHRFRQTGVTLLTALLIGFVVANLILKPCVDRIRPYEFNQAIVLLVPTPWDMSFPSGHTTASMAAATALLLCDRRFGIPAMVLALLIAFSRLYLYVHYPTDVLAGAVIGVAAAFGAYFLIKRLYPAASERWRQHQNRRSAT